MRLPALCHSVLAALVLAAPAAGQERDAETIYGQDCAWCHGGAGEGSPRGPSLVGVGAASAHFWLSTGRMPIDEPRVATRGEPAYSEQELEALVRLVAGFGEGPPVPDVDVAEADVARGGELYRVHCSACHGFSGWGGALAFQRHPPSLLPATPTHVVEAMLLGLPGMPSFGPGTFDDDERRDVAAYVTEVLQADVATRGGSPLRRTGPVSEGLAAWLLGFAALFLIARLLGERRPPHGRG